jgi:WD40 repeat protein
VAVSPDGKRFVTARRDGRLDVWDTATGRPVVRLATHRNGINAVAVSPDGRLAATLGHLDSARVWELATGKPVCVFRAPPSKGPAGHAWYPGRFAFTPDGRGLLYTAEGTLALASPRTGRPLELPAGLRGRRAAVGGFSADGKTLTTFAADVVTVWDWPAGTVRATVTVPLAPRKPGAPNEARVTALVKSATPSPDGRLLFTNSIRWVSAPKKGEFQNANDVWDGRTGKHLHRLTDAEMWYPPAAFSPDGRVLYLGGHGLWSAGRRMRSDALTAWDGAAGKLLRRFADADGGARPPRDERMGRSVIALAVSPDGRLLAAPEQLDPAVWVYETASGGVVKKLTGHRDWVMDLAFSPDGRRLVSVGQDQTGLVWDVTPQALGRARGGKLSEAWDVLAERDARLAYSGMASLAAAPAEAVRLLRARLRPAPVPTGAELDRVVGQLGAEAFADREKASAELERFGPNAVAGARERLGLSPAPEVRRRLRAFLERHDGPNPSPYHLRCVRGVGALESVGTAEARALLAELTKGSADDPLTREARAASRRAARR